MTRVALIAAFVLLVCFVSSAVSATCTAPSAISIANQPVLDSTPTTGTSIVENGFTHVNSNDSRLLQLSVNWNSVDNRTVSYVGLGPSAAACSGFIHDGVNGDQNGWTITDNSCVTNLFAQYTWPEALYGPTCAGVFNPSSTGDNFTVSFSIYIHFEDYVPTTRAGEIFYTTQSSQVIIPVILVYPKSVDVNLTNIRVFALSSITIDVSLTSQTVDNSPPFNVKFDTFVGRSFAISQTSIAYFNGSYTPDSVTLTTDGADTFVNATGNITRAQHWNIAIDPADDKCKFDGYYLVSVGIYWTGVDSAGTALPPSDNPIPNNTTASFGFLLQSQSFCGVLINNSISAVMQAYINPPTSSGHGGQTPHTGFIEEDTIYFRAAVESLNLPIKTVTLSELRYSPANGAPVVLVSGGTSPVQNQISYSAPALSAGLANETNFQFVAAHSIFNLGQDTSVLYTFDATLTVTYATGQKRNINVRQSSDTAGTAKASTTLTLQRAATTSSASSLALGMLSVFVAAIYLLLL